jgi:uncharacterized membrane protein YkoI
VHGHSIEQDPETLSKEKKMRAKLVSCLGAAALAAAGVAAFAGADSKSSPAAGPSRLDDGVQLLPQAKVTERQAIVAARSAASGGLNEVDLEHYRRRLVFNVDVGTKDVKVDANTGNVLATVSDDDTGSEGSGKADD